MSSYPCFGIAADVAFFTIRGGELRLLLIERHYPPHQGKWALPGGFIELDEDLPDAAVRELAEETGLIQRTEDLHEVGVYGRPGRDPRRRVVSVVYLTVGFGREPAAGDDAADARFVPLAEVMDHPDSLAFDHGDILAPALETLRRLVRTSPLATRLCPPEFTISELRQAYEAIWDTTIDPGNFTRSVLGTSGLVHATGARRTGARGRPPRLYRAGAATVIEPPIGPP